MRLRPVLVGILIVVSRTPVNAAERQLQLFIAVSFNGNTTFALLEYAARRPSVFYGGRALMLGEILGVEADFGDAPGYFQPGDPNLEPGGPVVLHSRVTTVTGNVMVSVPRRLTEYTLRPFFVGGAGLMRVRAADFFGALPVSNTQPAIDIGAGVSGFITRQIGLSWDLRHFRTLGGGDETGGPNFGQQLSFWRAGMALAVRF
jgi:hypothetical protein